MGSIHLQPRTGEQAVVTTPTLTPNLKPHSGMRILQHNFMAQLHAEAAILPLLSAPDF